MRERLQKLRESIAEIWTRMSKRQKLAISIGAGAVALGMLAAIIFFIAVGAAPKKEVLYSNLSGKDASAIVDELKKGSVNYELSDNGKSILVNKKDMAATRIDMAAKGLPTGGTTGYELFDETKLGVTDFTQKINHKRALEGELRRTIEGLAAVDTARVMIVQPEKSLFVTEQERPTASVAVRFKGKEKLTEDQVRGIMNLVAASLEGMKPGDVTVIDSNGNLLSDLEKKKDERERLQMTEIQLKNKIEIEERYEKKIREYLNKVFGEENVVVAVSAELDYSKTKQEDVRYEPIRPGADAGVIRSEQLIAEKYLGTGTVPEIGVPGTTSNIPGYKGLAEGNAEYNRTEETRNYEISEYHTTKEKNQGDIASLQVAVILNESKIKDSEGNLYREQGNAFTGQVEENIRSAANLRVRRYDTDGKTPIEQDTVDVKLFNFRELPGKSLSDQMADQERRKHILRLIYLGLLALMAICITVLSIISLRSMVEQEELPEEEPEELDEDLIEPVPVEELAVPELTDAQRMREKIREEVLRMIHDDPGGAALIVRSWLFDE